MKFKLRDIIGIPLAFIGCLLLDTGHLIGGEFTKYVIKKANIVKEQ